MFSWSFDIQRPTEFNINYYFERMPGFVTFAKMCARGYDSTVIVTHKEKLELALSLLWKCFDVKDSDGCIKDYDIFSVARRESVLCSLVHLIWKFRIRKVYNTIGNSWSGYFKSLTHPMVMGNWR